jgi:cytochrome c oxidase subunit 2
MSISGLTRGALGLLGAMAVAGSAMAGPLLGQPTPGGIGLQPPASETARSVAFFHNIILMPVITIIVLFVLGLIAYVCIRFNKKANPVPARFTHNTPVEVVWTIAPVIILMGIAVFSYKLLFAFHDQPRADLTVKATGVQWYWKYEYPDQQVPEFTSLMLDEQEARSAGVPHKLAVDNPLVVPVGEVVRILVTGEDVIHAFGVPAFGFVTDAIPGRLNEWWIKADREGVYYGQCRELCGVDHAFMPIQVNVVSRPEFNRWVLAQGGQPYRRAATAAAQPSAPANSDAAAAPRLEGAAPAAPAAGPAAANPAAGDSTPGDQRPNAPAPAAPAPNAQAAGAQPAPAQ